jgi:hypothetical protein
VSFLLPSSAGSLDSAVKFKSSLGSSTGGLTSVDPNAGLVVVGFEVAVVVVVVDARVGVVEAAIMNIKNLIELFFYACN